MQGGVWKAKFRAVLVSIGVWVISAVVLSSLTALHWFPGFLFWADGGFDLLKIILSVDIVLGPLLMFVIFNPNKTRKMQIIDIGVVASFQVLCFSIGLYIVYNQHPAFVSYYNHQFLSTRGMILNAQDPSPEVVDALTAGSPSMLFTVEPTKAQLPRVVMLGSQNDIPTNAQVELLQPIQGHVDALFENSAAIEALLKARQPEALQRAQTEYGSSGQLSYAWFSGRSKNAVLVFDSKAEYLGPIYLPDSLKNPGKSSQRGQPLFKKRIDKSTADTSLVRVPSDT